MAEILFSLPTELLIPTLSCLSPHDLTRCFELDNLLYDDHSDAYIYVKHAALYSRYLNQRLIMSNNESSNQLSIIQLKYLIKYNIIIKPKDVSFILFDNSESLNLFQTVLKYFLPYIERFTTSFSVQLLLIESIKVNNDLIKQIFEPFNYNKFKINWFTIRYNPCIHAQSTAAPASSFGYSSPLESEFNEGVTVQNLKLHLFNSNNLLNHLSSNSSCYLCHFLETLDLSYNDLTDDSIASIKFPTLLKNLNLSNNNLCILRNSNFNLTSLVNLTRLDVSNNNIMQFRFRQPENFPTPRLEYLNICCNNLQSYSDLFQVRNGFFSNLMEINLSRNLIHQLSPFPPWLEIINLNGNYLHKFILEIDGRIFPSNLRELHISYCQILNDHFDVPKAVNYLLSKEDLFHLKILEISGTLLDCCEHINVPPHLQIL